jgi:hypothetical protein
MPLRTYLTTLFLLTMFLYGFFMTGVLLISDYNKLFYILSIIVTTIWFYDLFYQIKELINKHNLNNWCYEIGNNSTYLVFNKEKTKQVFELDLKNHGDATLLYGNLIQLVKKNDKTTLKQIFGVDLKKCLKN